MTGDHHGRTAGGATLLVRAVDEILGTHRTVEKHVSSILTKLNLHEGDDDHRRVLAVITFLKAR
jgi:hypothetical protein